MSTVHRPYLILSLAFIALLYACAPNHELLKKQSEGSRRLGEVYLQEGNYTRALRIFFEAENIFADDAELQNDIGLAYMAKGKLDLAIERFQRALALDPDFSRAKNSLGVAYLKKKQWDKAIVYFEMLTEDLLYASPHLPLFNLGLAYYHKKDFRRAEQYFRKAIEQNAEFVDALYWLGRTYRATGKGKEAAAALEKAVKLFPTSQMLNFDLANAYLLTGDNQKAMGAFQTVVELDPESPLAAQAKKLADNLSK